jgi:hypothetical protein
MGRCVPEKRISGDISFSVKKGSRPIHVIEPLAVQNSLHIDLVLQGNYNSEINKLTLQFLMRGTGPICRFCINGRFHRGVGRTHKHHLHEEDDPGRNLPHAIASPDWAKASLEGAWQTICQQAKIAHNGSLHLPAGGK